MKRFSILALFTIVLCAIAMSPIMSVSNGDDIWQYVYYDYYFDMNGNIIGFNKSIWGELDEEVASARAYITRYRRQCSTASWESLTIGGNNFEKMMTENGGTGGIMVRLVGHSKLV